MTFAQVRNRYLDFFKSGDRKHVVVPSASLVPENDPTTLFTGSGMQPMAPYLLGEPHPAGKRVADVQKCFRSQDINEVGDNRHTTFFEMLGNWSFGDYFKVEQLGWFFEFLTRELVLDPGKLYVSVFSGTKDVPRDREAVEIWKKLFQMVGLEAGEAEEAEKKGLQEGRIFYYGPKETWWSRAGRPEEMPPGEPGGPASEVFYDFGEESMLHQRSPLKDQPCHPACDCGRFLEVGNSVFMTYRKNKDGSLSELSQKNIDFGGGLERLAAATEDQPDLFLTDAFRPIIKELESCLGISYDDGGCQKAIRVIADHMKAATFIIVDGVRPSKEDRGYVLRRLLRRSAVKMHELGRGLTPGPVLIKVACQVIKIYHRQSLYLDPTRHEKLVKEVVEKEMDQFAEALDLGLKQIKKQPLDKVDGRFAFGIYQSFGFPFEITQELLAQKGKELSREEFDQAFVEHQKISRSGMEKKFAGGLADHSGETTKLHTVTHLLHQSLREVLGDQVRQTGSNITQERLRFDFSYPAKLAPEQLKRVERLVNQKIQEDLPVSWEVVSLDKARQLGAVGLFGEKYGEKVKIYTIGAGSHPYSVEFCGGPHVDSTSQIGKIKITKERSAGSGVRRIYAVLDELNPE